MEMIMEHLELLVLFLVGSVGMTFIVVDGFIFQWLRDTPEWIKKKISFLKGGKIREGLFWFLDKITTLLHCHQCAGLWCGFITSLMILHLTWIQAFFVAGSATSILSKFLITYLNHLDAQTYISLPKEDEEV